MVQKYGPEYGSFMVLGPYFGPKKWTIRIACDEMSISDWTGE